MYSEKENGMYWGKGKQGGKQRRESIILRIKGALKTLKIRKEDIEGVNRAFLF